MRQGELFADPPAADPIEVLAQVDWQIHWGGINNLGGLWGKLTKCRAGAVTFYVRENVAIDHFLMSGGERQALKRGDVAARHPQVLELWAPPGQWDRVCALVAAADTLRRPVRRNRTLTPAWAEGKLRNRDRIGDP